MFRKSKKSVTVVISAYQRLEALNQTLKSLYLQTYSDWKAIVVCDCCPPEFMSRVDRSDKRVRYINLSNRCGNQYGPNSVGLHLANSEFIAFLNHDDIWLKDHLNNALQHLIKDGADAYLGRAAFCHLTNQPGWPGGPERLWFSELNRPEYIWRCMNGPFYFFEPASAFLVRTMLAKEVGYWRPPNKLNVTPFMDWIQRIAAKKGKFKIGDLVTVLKLNLHHRIQASGSKMPTYFQGDYGLHHVERMLNQSPEKIRAEISEDILLANDRKLLVREEMAGPVEFDSIEQNRLMGFLLYVQTGIKLPDLIGSPIGPYSPKAAYSALKNRTGETIIEFPPIDEVIHSIKPSEIKFWNL